MVKPIRAGSSPPGNLLASSANTGKIRNRPNMRRAKMKASEKLARRSSGVILFAATLLSPAIRASTLDKTEVSHYAKSPMTTATNRSIVHDPVNARS